MQATEFKAIAEGVSLKPGYALEVQVDSHRTRVVLAVTFSARFSDHKYASLGYPKRGNLFQRFETHDVDQLRDADDVYCTLLEFLTRVERHEWREFLRVPAEDWRAPLHPHTHDGQLLYVQRVDKAVPLQAVDV